MKKQTETGIADDEPIKERISGHAHEPIERADTNRIKRLAGIDPADELSQLDPGALVHLPGMRHIRIFQKRHSSPAYNIHSMPIDRKNRAA